MASESMSWREIDQKTQIFNVRKKNRKSIRPGKTYACITGIYNVIERPECPDTLPGDRAADASPFQDEWTPSQHRAACGRHMQGARGPAFKMGERRHYLLTPREKASG